MQTLNVQLPEPLHEFIHTRAAEAGFENVSDYLQELIRADQVQAARERLEQELVRGLESGEPIPMTKESWNTLREDFRRRHQTP